MRISAGRTESRKSTYVAFVSDGWNCQFLRLPFGLVNSVAAFIKGMDHAPGPVWDPSTGIESTVHVEDLLIISNNWEERYTRQGIVLKKLQVKNVTLKLDKSQL